jgi:hypothetical protein
MLSVEEMLLFLIYVEIYFNFNLFVAVKVKCVSTGVVTHLGS